MASAKIIELDETNTCKICDNALAKYSCPKCNILYCSLSCYQSGIHLECSENFYKDSVLQELNLDPNSSESKAKMLDILKRTHENNKISSSEFAESDDASNSDVDFDDIDPFSQFVDIEDLDEDLDSDDDDNFLNITERLAGVNLDDAEKVWEKLTEDEKQDFVAFLKTEDVAKLIPSWQPWWMHSEKGKIIEVDNANDFKSNCPKLGDIRDFSKVTTKIPANCVKYNLVNLLCAYAFATRYFNGEHFDFANEAVACIATISLALKKGQNFEDYETAVKSVEQECINCEWIITDSENLDLMRDDIAKILKGPYPQEENFYVLCALTDLQNLLKTCQKPKEQQNEAPGFNKQFPNEHFPQVQHETKEKIKKYLKKTDYFLSYAKDVLKF